MKDVVHQKCDHECCEKIPCFGFEGGKATRCVDHKDEGMEDVRNQKCDHCKTRASFGFEWGKATRCADHRDEGMDNVLCNRCEHEHCEKIPCFGFKGGNASRCVDHKEEGMEDVCNKTCKHGRRLDRCLGDACGKKIAGHSEEELFTNAAAWIAWGESSDAVAEFIKALDVRIYYNDGAQRRHLKPDLCLIEKKLIHEHDGVHYHTDANENDLHKNVVYVEQGFSVHRTRIGDMDAVKGSNDVFVSKNASREDMARATFNGICATSEEQWSSIWRSVDSLVRRALITAQKDGQQFIDTCFA